MKMGHMGDRGIMDYPQTEMEPCTCSAPMTNISLYYGRTPYGIFCKVCKTSFQNKITNCDVDGAKKAWNDFRRGGENIFQITPYPPAEKK
jgi:hypothetical protein